MSEPYVTELKSSLLETVAVLTSLLGAHGYSRSTIQAIAEAAFAESTREHFRSPAQLHLVSLKKTLLYAAPVIAPLDSSTGGIAITCQVATDAVLLSRSSARPFALAIGDRCRLLGFTFPQVLVNRLPLAVFPQKYMNNSFPSRSVALGSLEHITTHVNDDSLFIIDPSHYEDAVLFNQINRVVADCLFDEMTTVLHAPVAEVPIIARLNVCLDRAVGDQYVCSLFEVLHSTGNWLLYDQIALLGASSPEVDEQIKYLEYVKQQRRQVRQNVVVKVSELLRLARAERICRERYAYLFDSADHRAVFRKFTRFSIDKLPKHEQEEVQVLLKKELDAQEALLHNDCEHQAHMHSYKELKKFIDFETGPNVESMYRCKKCAYPIVCQHTVDLHDEIAASQEEFVAQQRIINRFKVINQRKEAEAQFSYYCRLCGGELGVSNDIVQANFKLATESSSRSEDPLEQDIFNAVSAIVGGHKALVRLLVDAMREGVLLYVRRAKKSELSKIDVLARYIAQVYGVAGMIVVKDAGDASLKRELTEGLKLLSGKSAFKSIGVTEAKIKALLVTAYRFMKSSLVVPVASSSSSENVTARVIRVPKTLSSSELQSVRLREKELRKRLLQLRAIPALDLPVENGREYDFRLKHLDMAYCLNKDKSVRLHRWSAAPGNTFSCVFCKKSMSQVDGKHDKAIAAQLRAQMLRDSFFELYTVGYPVKDMHVFVENSCSQCGVTKQHLVSRDHTYFDKFKADYEQFRADLTADLLASASAGQGQKQSEEVEPEHEEDALDQVELESLSTNLDKLFGDLGLDELGMRPRELVESSVRKFYAYYTFARNGGASHPDPHFVSLLKNLRGSFLLGDMPQLPSLPTARTPGRLVQDFLVIVMKLAGDSKVPKELLTLILARVAEDEQHRKDFSYGKLKVIGSREEAAPGEEEDNDEQQRDWFAGYDIEEEDAEDNMDGEIET